MDGTTDHKTQQALEHLKAGLDNALKDIQPDDIVATSLLWATEFLAVLIAASAPGADEQGIRTALVLFSAKRLHAASEDIAASLRLLNDLRLLDEFPHGNA